ncbi:hypothetical protein FXO37_05949 [Capsicum annuum]|nr:hypothetical protein FXO37_05949 [Capsicum annuum]
MALVSWAKKELSRFKLQKPKRLTLAEISTSTKCLALPLIQEVVLDADLRCANCQNRVSSVISNVEDVESMEVHILEKKVTLIHRSTGHELDFEVHSRRLAEKQRPTLDAKSESSVNMKVYPLADSVFKLVVAVFEVGKEFLVSCEFDHECYLQSCGILEALQNTFFRILKGYMEVVLVFVFFGGGVGGVGVGISGISGVFGSIGGGIGCGGGGSSVAMGGRSVGRY